MSKRKLNEEEVKDGKKYSTTKKYSLDSDEEDEPEDDNILDDNEIEGEEESIATNIGQERYTAFNMREEMEEGHFDKDGHFIWKNEKEVHDNWLDNIDWQTIKTSKYKEDEEPGLGDESDDSVGEPFEEIQVYKLILTYMQPKETITKSLSRLGGEGKKLSSIERLKRKKAGLLDSSKEVIELTALVDKMLSETGNMDVYQETYETIKKRIENFESKKKTKSAVSDPELDMYADDFDVKEKEKLEQAGPSTEDTKEAADSTPNDLIWELKWKQDEEKVEGPYNTLQMLKWANEGHFKNGAWVRKRGETNFYSTKRMDFELYI